MVAIHFALATIYGINTIYGSQSKVNCYHLTTVVWQSLIVGVIIQLVATIYGSQIWLPYMVATSWIITPTISDCQTTVVQWQLPVMYKDTSRLLLREKVTGITICVRVTVFLLQSTPHIGWSSQERWIYSSSCRQQQPTKHSQHGSITYFN